MMAEYEYAATVKIAASGTQHIKPQSDGSLDITSSAAGHMLISASNGADAPTSLDFSQKGFSLPSRKSEGYEDTFYTATFQINKKQYEKLKDYEKTLEKGESGYFAGSKRCIDTTYQILKGIGVNVHIDPLFRDTYEGNVVPKNNIAPIDVMLFHSTYGSSDYNFKENWHNNEFTKNNDRIVFNKTANQTTITASNPENLNKLIQKASNMGVKINDYKKSEVMINGITCLQITANTKFQEKGEWCVDKNNVDNEAIITQPIYTSKGYSKTDDADKVQKNVKDMGCMELMKYIFTTDLEIDDKEYDELLNAIKNEESNPSLEKSRKSIEEFKKELEKEQSKHNNKDDDDDVHRQ
jgi:hypothetical protein